MPDLPDRAGSRAVLFGVSDYRHLPAVPAARQNLKSLHGALTEPRAGVFDRSACVERLNPRSVDTFMQNLTRACLDATDVLLVYYSGHGVLDERGRLHLALGVTDPGRPQGNAVPFELVKEQVERARARVRVLVVDCCFSGKAMGWQAATVAQRQVVEVGERAVEIVADGMYVLTSTDATELGRFVVGESHTAFTDALLGALHPGDGREVRLQDLYGATFATLSRRGLPLPRCRQDDTAGRLIIRRGATTAGVAEARRPAPRPVHPRVRRGIVAGVVALAVATTLTISALARPAAAVFADEFTGSALDPARWIQPTQPEVVGVRDGALRFAVRPGAEVDTSLEPLLPTPFEEIAFDVTVPAYAMAGPGGVALIVKPNSDQPHWLAFGPTPGGPEIYPLICATPPCVNGVYEDFLEPTGRALVAVGTDERVPVRIAREDGRLRFYVRGSVVAETPGDPGPLVGFRFAISAADDESWDIAVDDLVCR